MDTELKKKLENSVEDHQRYWQTAKVLVELHKCFMCSKKFDEGIIVKGGGLSAQWAFHLETTHGVHRDVLVDWTTELLYSAYDEVPFTGNKVYSK